VIGAMAAGNAPPGRAGPGANPFAAPGPRSAFLALTIFVTLLQTANAGLKCYGHYLGTAVPDKPGTRLKAWALATFGLFCAATALSLSGSVIDIATGVGNNLSANPFATFGGGVGSVPMMIAAGFNIIGVLCYMAAFVMFILYLRALALVVRHRDLANTLKIFLISVCSVTTLLFVMGAIAVAVLGFAFLSAGPGAGAGPAPGQVNAALGGVLATGGLMCLGGLAYLGLGIWYIILVIQVRFAVVAFARPD
jgi:vacuolar-type H+-ATPase subunit I/STV1